MLPDSSQACCELPRLLEPSAIEGKEAFHALHAVRMMRQAVGHTSCIGIVTKIFPFYRLIKKQQGALSCIQCVYTAHN